MWFTNWEHLIQECSAYELLSFILYVEDQECKERYCYIKTESYLIGKLHFSYTSINTAFIGESFFPANMSLTFTTGIAFCKI